MNIDSALVRELAELLAETGLSEIEVEDGERKIRVSRQMIQQMSATLPPVGYPAEAAAVPAAPAAAAAPAPAPEAPVDAVKSPMVGTAYMSAEPGAAPFISVGQSVKEGDVLLIVEAMKVMNQITAPKSGTIKAILVDNQQPVEFDQPLVVIG
ncbi:acetyl-CoA carboxylase biotin carboxyl carrier protein [Novosphingobium decolorationis]|uniref:Biotin carboxyl carrier protein of acetyl-CoA carboxylase n=1 Tax=Novosphingobium decolorationis TaxID=2698673 RepID=A0ABX8E2A0_9SPHN|nr:acetyl-CoA carboxylase biotin carboxyl carrier protein [Novosphingobium decolorationis]QVM83257.1 acetyl-CoA carboxylase biotin carboxyl carrier protein [Novosphingobium decolorationis]